MKRRGALVRIRRARQLLDNGMALSGATVARIRGLRHPDEFAEAMGLVGRTVRRLEKHGATLHQALAIAGAEYERGDFHSTAYVLDMIGEPLELGPTWAAAEYRGPQ